jgi:hypothetical protein
MKSPLDLAPIRTLLATHPRLARADLSPVRRWIEEGADIDLDILPVIRHWMKQKPGIYSLNFFAPYVRESREGRIKRSILTPRQRAERIAFRRKLGQRHPTDERWLAGFEEVHGVVEI